MRANDVGGLLCGMLCVRRGVHKGKSLFIGLVGSVCESDVLER